MKKTHRTFAALLVLLIALFSFSITAGATEISNSQDGLIASITSDKDSYQENEDINLTFKITNTNDFAVENVSIEAIIPDGLTLKNQTDTKASTVSLGAGEELEFSLVALKASTVTEPSATEPSNETLPTNVTEPTKASNTTVTDPATITSNTTTTSKTTSSNSNSSNGKTADGKVATGDSSSYLLLALICIACLAVAIIAFKFRKKAVKYISLVLCVCIALSSVVILGIPNASAEETTQQMSFEVSKTITVDNQDYKLNAIIKYAVQTENSDDEFVPSRDADLYTDDDLYTTDPDESHIIFDENTGIRFIDNEICIEVKDGITQDAVESLCKKYNASIVSKISTLNSYKLRFTTTYSYEEINSLIEIIEAEDIIDKAYINYAVNNTVDSYYPISSEDRWTNDWNEVPVGANWGIEAIKAPEAWEYIDLMSEVNVGVYDEGFDINHDDLNKVIQNCSLNPSNPLDHGTHVAGIIGADFENGIGINGVSPTAKLSLVNYNCNNSDSYNFKYAMTYLIDEKNTKVVNISLGAWQEVIFAASQGESTAQKYLKSVSVDFENTLNQLLSRDEFVICTSAGNNRGYSYYKSDNAPYGYYLAGDKGTYLDRKSGNYLKWNGNDSPISGSNQAMADWKHLALISDKEVKKCIITVGAIQNDSDTTAKYSLCNFSDIGETVDVVAPGYDIESTVSNNGYEWQHVNEDGTISSWSGTSMASPHVAGIAAMLYSLDSDLTGDEVKRIICDTATTEVDGYKLVDAEAAVKEVLGQGNLSGEVVSSDNNTGISNVRVDTYLKLKSGTQYVDTVYTDDKGNFSMELQGGSYELRFNKDGYKTATTTITISKDVMTVLKDPIVMEKILEVNTCIESYASFNNFTTGSHAAAISDNGTLYMWGDNHIGQLGTEEVTASSTPIMVMSNVKSASLGRLFSAAITNNNELYMWGFNSNGQLGSGIIAHSSTPIKIMDNIASVSTASAHSGAITTDGDLYMWGWNTFGQLGNGTTTDSLVPIKIMSNVKSISLGVDHSCAITIDGDLYMWGDNDYGKLGNGTTTESLVPIKIMSNVKSVSLNSSRSAAITENGDLYLWGYGYFGNDTKTSSSIPIKVMSNVKSVSLGTDHNAVITENGDLYMWGYNSHGQVGDGTTTTCYTPTKIMSNVKHVSLGDTFSTAVTESGELYTWGGNSYGQLGNGTTTDIYTPTKITLVKQ